MHSHAGYPSGKLTDLFPGMGFLDVGEAEAFLLMPQALHGMRSSPETGPRSAAHEGARKTAEQDFAVRAPERDSAEWVERRQQRKVPRLCRANEVSSAPLSC